MVKIGTFEDEYSKIKEEHYHNHFIFDDTETFSKIAKSHFKKENKKERYGIYIIRETNKNGVIYIGKSGTIRTDGDFKGQDILGRLTNIRDKRPANKYFKDIVKKYKCPLKIEYCYLPKKESPTLIEALLLQSYYNNNKKKQLPEENKHF